MSHWRASFFIIFLLLFKYGCLHFPPPPLSPAPPTLTSHPQSHPLWLCPCVLYIYSLKTLPLPPAPITPSSLPSCYCQFVLYFNVSGYILLACLFCWLGSTYRWDHMVFVFHCLAYFTKAFFTIFTIPQSWKPTNGFPFFPFFFYDVSLWWNAKLIIWECNLLGNYKFHLKGQKHI